jgi:hypothetical protein
MTSKAFELAQLSDAVTVDGSGNVGFGVASPDQQLHVNSGTSNVVAKFESTDSIAAIQLTDNATEQRLTSIEARLDALEAD